MKIKREKIYTVEEDLRVIVDQYYPDLRKCLNTIQLSTQDQKLVIDKSVLVSSNYIDKVIANS